MTVSKLTSPPNQQEEIDKINEIIDNLGGGGGADTDLSNLTTQGNAKLQYAPFSINNGTVTDGANATLSYSGANLSCAACTITTADGRTKTFNASATIDCSSLANGTYRVLKDYTTGNISTVSAITVAKTAPSTPSSGDCWLDTSQSPLVFKTYNGSSWVSNNDKVYLGNVTISSGAITDVFNVDFNATREGEIVVSRKLLSNTTTLGSYAISLADYLPADLFKYEVFFSSYLKAKNSAALTVVSISGWGAWTNAVNAAYQICINDFSMVLDTKSISFSLVNATPQEQEFVALSYRRLGVI